MLEVGNWIKSNREAVYNTEVFDMGLMERGDHRSDWSHVCEYTASGNLSLRRPCIRLAFSILRMIRANPI